MGDYANIFGNRRRTVLPDVLQYDLERIGHQIQAGRIKPTDLDRCLERLSELPASTVVQAASDINFAASLWSHYLRRSFRAALLNLFRADDSTLLERTPGLEYLYLFHSNGYLREAALRKISEPIESPFLFSAVTYRLNDWVRPVREAAVQCAKRVFLLTDANIIADAALYLLSQKALWQRGQAEITVLDATMSRPDVVECLVSRLLNAATGTPSRVLLASLRDKAIDPYLDVLSLKAVQPSVRAAALSVLIKSQAKWAVGYDRQWIDKSMGQSRRILRFESRVVIHNLNLQALIERGASDRSAQVRKVAMQALIDEAGFWMSMKDCIAKLAIDKSPAVRAGISYILREQAKENH
jgi:hypothetical protein